VEVKSCAVRGIHSLPVAQLRLYSTHARSNVSRYDLVRLLFDARRESGFRKPVARFNRRRRDGHLVMIANKGGMDIDGDDRVGDEDDVEHSMSVWGNLGWC